MDLPEGLPHPVMTQAFPSKSSGVLPTTNVTQKESSPNMQAFVNMEGCKAGVGLPKLLNSYNAQCYCTVTWTRSILVRSYD